MRTLVGLGCAAILQSIVLLLAGWTLSATAEEAAVATEEEARALLDGILRSTQVIGKIPPGFRAELPLPLLKLLDSSDEQVRGVARSGFRELLVQGSLISVTKCLPYLQEEATIGDRAPLLALCLRQIGGYGETGPKEERAVLFSMARKLMGHDVCPPSFDLMANVVGRQYSSFLSSGGRIGFAPEQVVEADKQTLLGRRLLSAIGAVARLYPDDAGRAASSRSQVFEAAASFGEERMGACLEDWYRAEPDADARRVVVARGLVWEKDPAWAERRRAILELAAKDWDPEIAEGARKLLAEAK